MTEEKKTLKEQLEERKLNLDHVLAFSEDGQEFYTVEAVAAVFDGLVAEIQKRVEQLQKDRLNYAFAKPARIFDNGKITAFEEVLGLLGVDVEQTK